MGPQAKLLLLYTGLALGVVALWRGGSLKSDAEMFAYFAAHRSEFEQAVQWFKEDQQDMWIGSLPGQTWPEDLTSERGISLERLSAYRTLVARLGVNAISGSEQGVAFQTSPALSFFGPVKTYYYSTQPPQTLTTGDTRDFVFSAGQFRRVCRAFEVNWYVCVDYED